MQWIETNAKKFLMRKEFRGFSITSPILKGMAIIQLYLYRKGNGEEGGAPATILRIDSREIKRYNDHYAKVLILPRMQAAKYALEDFDD